jgi:hypothetical protein
MNDRKIEGEFATLGWWTIERHSAEHPEEGTKFIACITIFLPAGIHDELRKDLQLGFRVDIFCERLRASWGNPTIVNNQKYRCRRAYASGVTWHEAFEAAKEIIEGEERKLLATIQELR